MLPPSAQLYVAAVTLAGAPLILISLPSAWQQPLPFVALLVVACLTSLWKVTLLVPTKSDSTLSVSYAADLMALLLLGPAAATIVAVAGAWTQCTFNVKQHSPLHRTIFSMAAEAITLQATGVVYAALGGASHALSLSTLPKPVVGAICTYFVVNTILVAGAIALSARRPLWKVWHDNFLWSAPSFIVAGGAGALAALVVASGEYWLAILLFAPVYLTYRTYGVFLGRIEDQQLYVEKARKLHAEAVEALSLARRAERALAEETERLSVTLRSIGDGVITTDMHGCVQLLNCAAEALTGCTQAAVGKPLAQVFHSVDRETRVPCDPLAEFLRSPSRPGLPRCAELIGRDRTERPIEVTAAPLCDATGRTIGMALVFRDMSDAIRMQAERARADKLASLGLLAGGIAHDFNDILLAIMGNVSLARVTLPAQGQAAPALAEAERACVRARHLTWQLLTFSKGGAPVKKTMALPRVLEESARLALSGSNVSYELDFENDLWMVEADETQLVQVFNNVLRNAQQAMPHGGTIVVRAENVIERTHRCEYALQAEAGRYVRISIADQGIGIPHENLGSIFDPYFTTKQSGSGLGLATSQSIIKNHAGFVTVDSTLGRGTTMHIHLPAAVETEIEEEVGPVDWGAFRTGRILVMDDDPSSRALAVSMLEFLGYQPEAVSSGTAAVERYRDALSNGCPFDAVILDLVVPEGTGGKETMERLGQLDGRVTAILASGYVQASMTTEFQQLGFKAVVPKPYTIDELSRTLDSVMSSASTRVH